MPPGPRPPRPAKPKGTTTSSANIPGQHATMTVTSENGHPVRYEKWDSTNGVVMSQGDLPAKIKGK